MGHLITILVFVFASLSAVYAKTEVTLGLSSPRTQVGAPVEMVLTVRGARSFISVAYMPISLRIEGLKIKEINRKGRIEMANYEMANYEKTWSFIGTYQIQPIREGDFKIPPVEVKVGDKSIFSNAISLRVAPEAVDEANKLLLQGNEHHNHGNYQEALSLYQRSLEIYEKVRGPQHPDTATNLARIAEVYRTTGDYAKALPLLERSLSIQEKSFGSQHPNAATVLKNLGEVYNSIGDYSKALPLFERALAIQEKSFGSQHPNAATILYNLGEVYNSMGDYDKALPLFERALAIREKSLGFDHSDTAANLNKLGEVYSSMGDYAKALPLFERVQAIREKSLGFEHSITEKSLNNLAEVYNSMGDYAKALPLFERALAIREKALGPHHPQTATSLNNLADVCSSLGDYVKAQSLHERALAIREKSLGPQHPNTAVSLNNLAHLTYRMGDFLSARNYASRQIAAKQRELQSILTLDEHTRLAWQKKNLSYWTACVLRPEPLAQLVLRWKGVVLDSLLEDRSLAISAQHDPEDRAKLEEIATLRSKLAKISLDNQHQQEAASLQEQIGLLQRALSKRASLGGRIRQSAEITLDAILPSLSKGEVLVDFIRFKDPKLKGDEAACYGAVVTGGDGSPAFVRIEGAQAIDRAVDALRSAITQGNETEVESQTHFLSEKLWQPIAAKIPRDAKHLFICPDANLNFLSFAALLESDGRFVAEKYPIAYLGSGRDLARKPSSSPSKTLALFANPDFDISSSSSPSREMLAMRSAEADAFGTIALPPLPGTESEAKSLQFLAKSHDWQTQAALGAEATEASVRQVKKPGILHLATHGFYLDSSDSAPAKDSRGMSVIEASDNEPALPMAPRSHVVDPMRASGVALTGAQSTLKSWSQRRAPDPENDGILTAEEVASLDLEGTWLVTLSACETGVGEARSGEGVFGLRRAFMIAGAENLLMTLWPVADATTAQIMGDFYRRAFASGDAPGSLATVQRDWLVKLREERGLAAAVKEAGPFALVMMTAQINLEPDIPNPNIPGNPQTQPAPQSKLPFLR
jgi:tetratricopeptide (TPR) repeat protein